MLNNAAKRKNLSKTKLLLGCEAVAQGALDAGVSGFYSYPGTPATEIMQHAQHAEPALARNVHREWSSNEKTALEAAMGMSYVGKRALASMKHVGLNIAADAFMNCAMTGVNGGLVVAVADDPSMHSSQNEQDSRFYGRFAMIPILEPASEQEAYDMTHIAFQMSEDFQIPVMIRIPTRLAHCRSNVTLMPPQPEKEIKMPEDHMQFVLVPQSARIKWQRLLAKQKHFLNASETSPYNFLTQGIDKSQGVIAAGLAYNYLPECSENEKRAYSVLRIGQYPLPKTLIKEFLQECDEILVLEEGYPFIEEMLQFSENCAIKGRLDGTLPRGGELTPCRISAALNKNTEPPPSPSEIVVPRSPLLCDGCPHTDSLNFIIESAAKHTGSRIFSDIGCYTLGILPPINLISTCVNMGTSITMAKGAADAGVHPVAAIIGDSTFSHSGMTGLLDCVTEHSSITVIILDNDVLAMTGGQNSTGAGKIENIVLGLGVNPDHIKVLTPVPENHKKNVQILEDELAHDDVSVIVSKRPCIHVARKKKKHSS